MKNIFLVAVVICALVVAGVGGTLAGFSDTERSLNNFFEVGNMDLRVSVAGVEYDDPNVPPIAQAYLAWPCNSQDFSFDLHNVSDNPQAGHAYVRFKDFTCYDVFTTKFPDVDPEPEIVAEYGGCLANKMTPEMGEWGNNCTLADFVEVYFSYDGRIVAGTNTPWGGEGTIYLSDLLPPDWTPGDDPDNIKWICLGDIPGCTTKYGDIALHISNWSEEEWLARFPGSNVGDNFANDLPFNDWLTNLFQNDGVNFTIEFALTQDPMPSQYLWAPCPPATVATTTPG